MFNGYKPDWTPLEIEIELYDIGTKVKTSAGRKGVIIDYRIFIYMGLYTMIYNKKFESAHRYKIHIGQKLILKIQKIWVTPKYRKW